MVTVVSVVVMLIFGAFGAAFAEAFSFGAFFGGVVVGFSHVLPLTPQGFAQGVKGEEGTQMTRSCISCAREISH